MSDPSNLNAPFVETTYQDWSIENPYDNPLESYGRYTENVRNEYLAAGKYDETIESQINYNLSQVLSEEGILTEDNSQEIEDILSSYSKPDLGSSIKTLLDEEDTENQYLSEEDRQKINLYATAQDLDEDASPFDIDPDQAVELSEIVRRTNQKKFTDKFKKGELLAAVIEDEEGNEFFLGGNIPEGMTESDVIRESAKYGVTPKHLFNLRYKREEHPQGKGLKRYEVDQRLLAEAEVREVIENIDPANKAALYGLAKNYGENATWDAGDKLNDWATDGFSDIVRTFRIGWNDLVGDDEERDELIAESNKKTLQDYYQERTDVAKLRLIGELSEATGFSSEVLEDVVSELIVKYAFEGDSKENVKPFLKYTDNEEELGQNVYQTRYSGVLVANELMLSPSDFNRALRQANVTEAEAAQANAQRELAVVDNFERISGLLSKDDAFSEEWGDALIEGKQRGLSNSKILEKFRAEFDFSPILHRAKGVLSSVWEGATSIAYGIGAAMDTDWGREGLLQIAEDNAHDREIAKVFGLEMGGEQDLAEAIAPLFADALVTAGLVLVTKPTAGTSLAGLAAYTGAKSTATASARAVISAASRGMLKTVGKETAEQAAERILKAGALKGATKERTLAVVKAYNGNIASKLGVGTAAFIPAATRSGANTYGAVFKTVSDDLTSKHKGEDGQWEEGWSEERVKQESHDKAFGSALTAGTITGLLTSSFSVLGRGGLEDAFLQGMSFRQMRQITSNVLGRNVGDETFKALIKNSLKKVTRKHALMEAPKKFARSALDEGFEEGLDEFFNIIVQDVYTNQDTGMLDRIQQVWHGFLIGAALGGGGNVVSKAAKNIAPDKFLDRAAAARVEQEVFKQFEADVEAQGLGDQLREAGSPATAQEAERQVRQYKRSERPQMEARLSSAPIDEEEDVVGEADVVIEEETQELTQEDLDEINYLLQTEVTSEAIEAEISNMQAQNLQQGNNPEIEGTAAEQALADSEGQAVAGSVAITSEHPAKKINPDYKQDYEATLLSIDAKRKLHQKMEKRIMALTGNPAVRATRELKLAENENRAFSKKKAAFMRMKAKETLDANLAKQAESDAKGVDTRTELTLEQQFSKRGQFKKGDKVTYYDREGAPYTAIFIEYKEDKKRGLRAARVRKVGAPENTSQNIKEEENGTFKLTEGHSDQPLVGSEVAKFEAQQRKIKAQQRGIKASGIDPLVNAGFAHQLTVDQLERLGVATDKMDRASLNTLTKELKKRIQEKYPVQTDAFTKKASSMPKVYGGQGKVFLDDKGRGIFNNDPVAMLTFLESGIAIPVPSTAIDSGTINPSFELSTGTGQRYVTDIRVQESGGTVSAKTAFNKVGALEEDYSVIANLASRLNELKQNVNLNQLEDLKVVNPFNTRTKSIKLSTIYDRVKDFNTFTNIFENIYATDSFYKGMSKAFKETANIAASLEMQISVLEYAQNISANAEVDPTPFNASAVLRRQGKYAMGQQIARKKRATRSFVSVLDPNSDLYQDTNVAAVAQDTYVAPKPNPLPPLPTRKVKDYGETLIEEGVEAMKGSTELTAKVAAIVDKEYHNEAGRAFDLEPDELFDELIQFASKGAFRNNRPLVDLQSDLKRGLYGEQGQTVRKVFRTFSLMNPNVDATIENDAFFLQEFKTDLQQIAGADYTVTDDQVVTFYTDISKSQEANHQRAIVNGRSMDINEAINRTHLEGLGITDNSPEGVINALEKLTTFKNKKSPLSPLGAAAEVFLTDTSFIRKIKFSFEATAANYAGKTYTDRNGVTNIVINLARDAEGGVAQTLVHELSHAFTNRVIDLPAEARTPEQNNALNRVESLIKLLRKRATRENAPDSVLYGLTNIEEFSAAIMTSQDFQSFLSGMKVGDGQRSFLTRAIAAISRLIARAGRAQAKADKAMQDVLTLVGKRNFPDPESRTGFTNHVAATVNRRQISRSRLATSIGMAEDINVNEALDNAAVEYFAFVVDYVPDEINVVMDNTTDVIAEWDAETESIVFNGRRAAAKVNQMVAEVDGAPIRRDHILAAILNEEIAHVASFARLSQEEIQNLMASLNDVDAQSIIEQYYPEGERAEALERFRSEDAAVSEAERFILAEEQLRIHVQKVLRGTETNEQVNFLLENPTTLDTVKEYFKTYLTKVTYARKLKDVSPEMRDAVNRVVAEVRAMEAGYRLTPNGMHFDISNPEGGLNQILRQLEMHQSITPRDDEDTTRLQSRVGSDTDLKLSDFDVDSFPSEFDLFKTKGGKIKGAPPQVKSDKGVEKLMDRLKQLTIEGAVGRFWYEDAADKILEITNGDLVEAEKFTALLAIYSPQTGVEVNTYFAVRAYEQHANGVSRAGLKVKTKVQDDKARAVLYDKAPWKGRKTDNFYKNLMFHLVSKASPEELASMQIDTEFLNDIQQPVTVDMWVYRAMGYDTIGLTDDKGQGAFGFSEKLINRLAYALNQNRAPEAAPFQAHQIQAMLWTAIKARSEDKDVKEKTEAQSIRAGDLKLIYPKGKKIRKFTSKEGERKHQLRWTKNALAAEGVDFIEASRSFDYFVNSMGLTATWEVIASEQTPIGKKLAAMTPEQKRSFTQQAMQLIVDPVTGEDTLARDLGIAISTARMSMGGYAGGVTPNVLSTLYPNKPAGDYDDDAIRAYARSLQYIFMQDAVPWVRYVKKNKQDVHYRVLKGDKAVQKGGKFATQEEAIKFSQEKNATIDTPQVVKVDGGYQILNSKGKPYKLKSKETNKMEEIPVFKPDEDTLRNEHQDEDGIFEDGWDEARVVRDADSNAQSDAEEFANKSILTYVAGNEQSHGFILTFDEDLTAEKEQEIQDTLGDIHPDLGFTKIDSNQITVINFKIDYKDMLPELTDDTFTTKLAERYEEQATFEEITTVGEYGFHDWDADKEGEGILSLSPRLTPDIQQKVRDRRERFLQTASDTEGTVTPRLQSRYGANSYIPKEIDAASVDFSNWVEMLDIPLMEFGTYKSPSSIFKKLVKGYADRDLIRLKEERDSFVREAKKLAEDFKQEHDRLIKEAEKNGIEIPPELISRASGSNQGTQLTDEQIDNVEARFNKERAKANRATDPKRRALLLEIAEKNKLQNAKNLRLENRKVLLADRDQALKDLVAISPEAHKMILNLRKLIDDLSAKGNELFSDFIQGKDEFNAVFDMNGGLYITRRYRMFEDNDYLARVRDETDPTYAQERQDAINYFAKQYMDYHVAREMEKGLSKKDARFNVQLDLEEKGSSARTKGKDLMTEFLNAYEKNAITKELDIYQSADGGRSIMMNEKKFKGSVLNALAKNLNQKQNIPSPIRRLLGEFGDESAAGNLAHTLVHTSTVMANQAFFNRIVEYGTKGNKPWLVTAEMIEEDLDLPVSQQKYTGWQKLKGDGGPTDWNPLKGYYTRPEIVKEFDDLINMSKAEVVSKETSNPALYVASKLLGYLHRGTGLSLASKTLGSPGFYVRNMLGNAMFFGPMQGYVGGVGKAFGEVSGVSKALLGDAEGSKSMIVRAAMGSRAAMDAELTVLASMNVFGDELEANLLRDLLTGKMTIPDAESQLAKIAKKVEGVVKVGNKAYDSAVGMATRLASAMDAYYKIGLYEFELDTLLRAAKADPAGGEFARLLDADGNPSVDMKRAAALKVKKVSQSYSQAPPVIKALTRHPVGLLVAPYVRFAAEIPRVTANTFSLIREEKRQGKTNPVMRARYRKRLSGMIGTMSFTFAVPAFLKLLAGIGEDEDEALRLGMPFYLRDHTFYYLKEKDGDVWSLDLTYLNPFSVIADPVARSFEALFDEGEINPLDAGIELVTGLFRPYFNEQILSGAVSDVISNKNQYGDKILYGDDVPKNVLRGFKYIWEKAYEPRALAKLRQAYRSIEGDNPSNDMFTSPLGVIFSEFLPVKPHKLDLNSSLRNYLRTHTEDYREINSKQNALLSTKSSMLDSDIFDIYDNIYTTRLSMNNEFRRIMRAYNNLGISWNEISAQAKSRGVSKERLTLNYNGWMNRPVLSKFIEDRLKTTPVGRQRSRKFFNYGNKYDRYIPLED